MPRLPVRQACEHSECSAENRGVVPLRLERWIERAAPVIVEEVAAELAAERCASAREVDHRPGARRPGHKPAPPVPRWARDR